MKRYASHFLFLPGHGYLRRYAIEMEEGVVVRLFPLTEEVENTEWMPGVIALLSSAETRLKKEDSEPIFKGCRNLLGALPPDMEGTLPFLTPYLYFPFCFTTMQPVAGTQRRRLQ